MPQVKWLEIEADLTLLPIAAEHMRNPIYSGTRAFHMNFEFQDTNWMSDITLYDRAFLYPGETARVTVRFAFPDNLADRVVPGTPFFLRYAGRMVAEGIIITVL